MSTYFKSVRNITNELQVGCSYHCHLVEWKVFLELDNALLEIAAIHYLILLILISTCKLYNKIKKLDFIMIFL